MLRSTPDTTEEFWQKVESALQCKVQAYALTQYSTSITKRGNKNALWGLLYISERGVHFYRFAQQSWMGAVMNRAPTEEFSFTIHFEDLQTWQAPPKLAFFKSLFSAKNSHLVVQGKSVHLPLFDLQERAAPKPQEETMTHYFALDVRKHEIVEALTLYAGEKRSIQDAP